MSAVSTSSSQYNLPRPSALEIHLDVSSSPSPAHRTASTTVSSRATRTKLAGRIKPMRLVKIKKHKKTRNAKKAGFLKSTSKPVYALTSVKLAGSSPSVVGSSPTSVSFLGKRTRHQSANPSAELVEKLARSTKKRKHWAGDSSDSEDAPSRSVQRPQPANIPSWIEARRNEHREQIAPYPWGGSILRFRSPLYQSTLYEETSPLSSSDPIRYPLVISKPWSLNEQLKVLPPTIHSAFAGLIETNSSILEKSRRKQHLFHVCVLLSISFLFCLFLLLL